MICLDCLPFYTVEKPGFRRFLNTIEPRYTPCSRTYLSETLIPSMYEAVVNGVQQLLEQQPHVSITTDLWSSDNQDGYLSFTAHWIDDNWNYKECCLPAQPFNERHTGENIASTFTSCMEQWHICEKVHLVLRDNGSNFVAGFRDAGILAFGCFAHTLQLVVHDGVLAQRGVQTLLSVSRQVVRHFKHSNVSLQALKSIQQRLDIPQHRPIQDQATWWNSSYYMLEWLMEQRQAILAVTSEVNLPVEITTTQWQLMGKVLRVLKPFEEATKEASYANASIGIVVALVNALVRQLESNDNDEGIRNMKTQLLTSLNHRFHNIESFKHYTLATCTLLDPRYKLRCFSCPSKATATKEMLVDECKSCDITSCELQVNSVNHVSIVESSLLETVDNMMSECPLDESHDEEFESLHAYQIGPYLAEPNIPLYTSHPDLVDPLKVIKKRCDPLSYWQNNSNSKPMPILAKCARRYLHVCAPPGSIASESLFSTAADIADDKRNRLLSEKVEMLLFLKTNLQLLNFQY